MAAAAIGAAGTVKHMTPRIRATFVLRNNTPEYEDAGGKRHYSIVLSIENAPPETHAVTYELHESYYDSKREVRTKPDFAEEITSYGDYVVRAKIRSKARTEFSSARLSQALLETHGDDPRTKQGLDDIANN
jgi:hypothetical protein